MNDKTDETSTRPSDSWLSLEEACNYSMGAASTCWIPDTGAAEFDAKKALEVSAELQRYVTTKYDSLLNPNRSKGEKIVADCLLTGEPFFVFRGRDIFTPMVIKRYIQQLEEVGPDDPDMQASVVDFLAMLRKWQAANITKVRYPD